MEFFQDKKKEKKQKVYTEYKSTETFQWTHRKLCCGALLTDDWQERENQSHNDQNQHNVEDQFFNG